MNGLVCIVAHERTAPVSEAEIADLATAYESLRGQACRHPAGVNQFAKAVGFTSARSANSHQAGEMSAADSLPTTLVSGNPHTISGDFSDLQDLDGQFVWLSYDATTDELSVATDPFGMQAVFLGRSAGKTYISTSALALAKHLRATPSQLGISTYLRTGYQFGSVTHWEGIERIDPGTRISFTCDGPRREVYWRPSVDDTLTRLDLAEASKHCVETVVATFRSRLDRRQRAWADLTGGYDSRLMCLLLRKAGLGFAANTVGPAESHDVRIAADIAHLGGWDWSRFDIPERWPEVLPRIIAQAVGWGDCHLDAVQLAEVLWSHAAKARALPSLFNGGGGEHFQSYAWQQEFLNAGRSTHVNLDNWVHMMMMRPLNTAVFVRDPTAEVVDNLRRRMNAYAEPYAAHLNTVQLDMMYAYKCTGHFGAYASAASGLLDVILPYYLKPVFNTAFSMSHRHRTGHRLMRSMIEALNPPIAAVRTMKGGPAQRLRVGNAHRFIPYYGLIARKAVTKVSERLLGRPLLLPPSPTSPVRAAARQALVDHLEGGRPLRSSRMRSGPLFDRAAMDSLLARAGDPQLEDATLLQRILTVEMALRATDAALDAG